MGALVNATFGSITEMTFYITALIRGHKAGNPCLQEIVKAALTGTLFGCILFIPVSLSSVPWTLTALGLSWLSSPWQHLLLNHN